MVVAPDRLTTSDSAPKEALGTGGAARTEAISGYENFSNVKKAMTSSYKPPLSDVAFTGMNPTETKGGTRPESAPAGSPDDSAKAKTSGAAPEVLAKPAAIAGRMPPIEGDKDKDSLPPGVIDPGDLSPYKTPVIPIAPWPDDSPVDENGNHAKEPDLPNPDLPADTAATTKDTNGKTNISTTEMSDDGTKTTTSFDLDAKGNPTKRTIDGPDGKDEDKLDSSGQVVSRMHTKPGSTEPKKVAVGPNEKVTVQKGADGKPVSLVSEDGDNTTKLTLDKDGKVSSRSIGRGDEDINTDFDKDGNVTRDEVTHYDKDSGRKKDDTVVTAAETKTDTYDADGKLTKTETWAGQDDTHVINQTLPDGSTMTRAQSDGVDHAIITTPDGTVIDYKKDDNQLTQSTKITSPDGSFRSTMENHDSYMTYKQDADGFWEAGILYKRTGVATRTQGGPGQEPNDTFLFNGQTSTPI